VVDDNADNRALARATLEDEGYEVVLATHGEEGLLVIASAPPDCVLLDVRMPGMDGFAVCDRIRGMPNGADIPVVFLTALRDVDTFDRALRGGGDDFLTKPVRPAELLARVQSALKLRRMSAELREHYELVRRQRDDLMRLQLQKERLTAFLIHDLKNPVSSMDLHAQLLLRNRDLPQNARKSVEHIREGARSLVRMLLNLLDISKSEEGQLTPQYGEVDPLALVVEVIDALEITAREAGVTLQHSIQLTQKLRGDVDLLRRVLENLLENAVRHAPPASVVRIGLALNEDSVELRVANSGKGVALELREKVFERFVQLEHGERLMSRSGRGLGLSFCKLAVEAHAGRIWVEDGAPGAVFCVRLPR
jgi:signal transduction histidine kinase